MHVISTGACAAAAVIATAVTIISAPAVAKVPAARNVVLVHGALTDGSGWRAVHDILRRDGYRVSIVQQPLTGFDADVAATRRVLDRQDGPVVLVGHSYGGAVISVAGNSPIVKALVYVAALMPDEGESVADLNARIPTGSGNHLKQTPDGFVYFPEAAKFIADIAADLPDATAQFMAASQVDSAGASFSVKLPAVAWHDKPVYGIVATQDKTLNPDLERFMYRRANAKIVEAKGSHMVHVSQPAVVAKVIERAASGLD
jgi:pimeloyl-ACP methyl ester carboxylesterase